jgi:PAS domain S-box-containing protein
MSVSSAQALKPPVDTSGKDVDPSALQVTIRTLRGELADAQRRLRESEERWDLLVLAAEQGIWEWVPGTEQMSWSTQFTRMLGYADGEIAPSVASLNALLHPDDAASVWRAFDEHVGGKTPLYESEFRLRAKDGGYRWIRSRGKAKVDEKGRAVRLVGLTADITALRQAAIEGPGALAPRAPKPTGSLDLPVAKTHCSTCKSDLLYRSRWRLWERPLMLLLIRPVRCRSCGRRAFKPIWAGVPAASNPYRKSPNWPSDS